MCCPKDWLFTRAIALCLIVLATSQALAGDCVDYGRYLHWEDSVTLPHDGLEIVINEPLARAYVTMTTGVAAITLADPAAPTVTDTLNLGVELGEVATMTLEGDRLWIAAGTHGFFAVSNDLTLISHVATPAETRDLALSGSLVAVAEWDQGLQIFDGSNAAAPAWRGGIDLPGFAVAVALSDHLAYVVDMVSLTIIDVTQPTSPMIVGSIFLPGQCSDVMVDGDRAYVPSNKAMYVIDISDPHHPSLMGQLTGYCTGVAAIDSQVVGLSRPGGVMLVDVSDPTAPISLTEINVRGNTDGIATFGPRIFIPNREQLQVINHEHLAFPPITGRIDQSSLGAYGVAREGDWAYVLGNDRLSVIDISSPTAPAVRGHIDAYPWMMTVGEGFLYLIQEDDCLVVDLADPTSPRIVGQIESPEIPRDCALAADRLYVTGYSGLEVLDVSNPASPVSLGTFDEPNPLTAIEADAQFLYVGVLVSPFECRMDVIDATAPSTPQTIGSCALEADVVRDIKLAGSILYAITGGSGSPVKLATIDVADPASPRVLAHVGLPVSNDYFETRISVTGSMVYLAIGNSLQVIDVSLPASPTVVGSRFDVRASAIDASGDWLLAADFSRFLILPLQCQSPAPVELSRFEAEPVPGAIRLTWHTSREWDHLGFYVERSGAAAGPYHRLTELIPPPSPYTYLDRDVAPGVTYFYRLAAVDRAGRTEIHGPVSATATASPTQAPPPKPNVYELAQSYPNPFEIGDQETAIAYSLAAPGQARLRVFDATGRLVANLVNAELPAGEHLATWDGRTVRGETAPAGTYFYRLEAGSYSATQQLVRLR
jgi:hypothetical protein